MPPIARKGYQKKWVGRMKIGLVQFSFWFNFLSDRVTKKCPEWRINFCMMSCQERNRTSQKTAPRSLKKKAKYFLFSDKPSLTQIASHVTHMIGSLTSLLSSCMGLWLTFRYRCLKFAIS